DDVTGKTRGRTGANLCVTKSAPCWCMWWRQVAPACWRAAGLEAERATPALALAGCATGMRPGAGCRRARLRSVHPGTHQVPVLNLRGCDCDEEREGSAWRAGQVLVA